MENILSFLKSQHQDHNADQLVKEMDESGITSSILLLPDFTYAFRHDLDIVEMVRMHCRILERHPNRFYLFAGVDPRSAGAVGTFQRLVDDYNIAGLKIYPPCGYSPSSESLFPFYEICQERRLPVLLHTGPTSPTLEFKYSQPGLIDAAAKSFPGVNFILGHGGVNFVEECTLLCAYRDNIYLDFSAFTSTHSPLGWKKQLARLFQSKINHKIIFGTDWPVARESGGLKSTLVQLLQEEGPFKDVSSDDKECIFSRNILRLLPYQIARYEHGLGDISAVNS
jgi:predicted TIM-barrel fold metal-dependent hydrolase